MKSIFKNSAEANGSHLERVDVERSHGPRVLVALSDDHVGLSRHDLGGVVQDHVAVLASCNKDPRWVAFVIHSIGTPHQFVISMNGGGGTMLVNSCTQKEKKCGKHQQLLAPVRGGEAAT